MLFMTVLLLFSTLLIVIPIVLRILNILPLIFIGCFLPLLGCFMLTNYYTFKPDRIYEDRVYYFKFYRRENWKKNLEYLGSIDSLSVEDRQLYPNNFLINDTLNTLINSIIDNFVSSWSRKISFSNSFETSVHHVLSFSFKSLIERLNKMNYPDVLVVNIIPIINDHIKNFVSANELAKETVNTTKNHEEQLILNYNKGKLHPGLRFNSPTLQDDVKMYLSTLVDRILPFLLESNEMNSRSSCVLVRELLASCVLNPICQMLSDPDFLNQSIVDILSKQIKDRNSVKQIRSILRQHSRDISDQPFSNIDILNYKLSPSSSLEEFLEVANFAESLKDLEAVQKFKVLCLLQKHRFQTSTIKTQIDESKDLNKYVKRIDTLCFFIDNKVRGENVHWKSLQSVDLASYPYEKYPEIEFPDIALESIISSQSRLKYFQLFMQQRGERRFLLDFIIETEGFKNPLEYNTEAGDPTISALREDEESSDEENCVFVDKSFSQYEEIIRLFKTFFDLSIMKVPPKIYYKVNEYVEGNHKELLLYNRARRNMLKLRSYEYNRMLKTDFKAFQQSEIWTKMMIEELSKHIIDTNSVDLEAEKQITVAIPKIEQSQYGDPLAVYREKEDKGNYVDVNLTGKVSNKVVQAVEDALSQIVDDQDQLEITEITEQHEKKNSRLVSDDVMTDLFGADNSGLFSAVDDTFEESVLASVNSNENDDSSYKVSDSDSTIHEEMLASVDFLPIAPNVLDMSKEISLLEQDIYRLREQTLIINTLLNKAEVVNNIPECRILRKSLFSLEKEIKLKNLQKEQLKVQEGENSLYQKSDVEITNYVTVKDKSGKPFVMYVIKVLRYSSSDKLECIASWIVTRRFNQFYELHRHLKEIYPEVGKIDFPKKTVMVKFLPSALIEERQQTLGRYLGKLITMKDVCADRHFRAFLSSETFESNTRGEQSFASKSSTFIDELSTHSLLPLMSLVDRETPEIIDTAINDKSNQNREGNLVKMSEPSFTKPICEMVILLFQLSKSTNWFRGKGLILLFQQIFGTTIEKIIRKIVDGKIRNEENVSLIMMSLVSTLFPNGNFKQKSTPRSQFEKTNTKRQARTVLALFLNDTTAKVFGRNAAKEAAELSYAIFQNEFLNKQLILSLVDELFLCLFPELRQNSS